MAISATTALIFLPFVLPVCLWAAWSDMAAMKIPNLSVLALVGLFVVLAPFALPLEVVPWRLLQLIGVLVIGFLLNLAGLIGAGDAKFAAGMALYVDPGDVGPFCYLFAAVILAAFVTHRTARAVPAIRRAAPRWESWERADFPMGLALGGTLALYLIFGAAFGS